MGHVRLAPDRAADPSDDGRRSSAYDGVLPIGSPGSWHCAQRSSLS